MHIHDSFTFIKKNIYVYTSYIVDERLLFLVLTEYLYA